MPCRPASSDVRGAWAAAPAATQQGQQQRSFKPSWAKAGQK